MVDIYFYREFMGHINDGDTPPSHISNDRLVMKSANGVPSLEEHAKFAAARAARDMGPIPRPDLRENKDVVLLCQGQWDYLASIYGGGPALECLCVSARRGDGNHTSDPLSSRLVPCGSLNSFTHLFTWSCPMIITPPHMTRTPPPLRSCQLPHLTLTFPCHLLFSNTNQA